MASADLSSRPDYVDACDNCWHVFQRHELRILCCQHAFCQECLPEERQDQVDPVCCLTCLKTSKLHFVRKEEKIENTLNFDDGICSICLFPHEDKARVTCGHVFCLQCLMKWMEIKVACPACGQPFRKFFIKSSQSRQRLLLTPMEEIKNQVKKEASISR